MRPNPVPAPAVAQPLPPKDAQKVRKPATDSAHGPRNEPGTRPDPETSAYDDFSWM